MKGTVKLREQDCRVVALDKVEQDGASQQGDENDVTSPEEIFLLSF